MDEAPKDILKAISEKVNREDTFSQRVGVRLIELLPGFARTTLPITGETVNIYQMAHGGAIFSVADQPVKQQGTALESQPLRSNKTFTSWLRVDLETSLRPQQRWFIDPTESV